MSEPVKAVLFDIGGVIVTDGPDMGVVAQMLGLEPTPETVERVNKAVWGIRDAYDLGLPDADYWAQVADAAGAEQPSATTVATLTQTDVSRWADANPDSVALVQEVHAAGVKVGVLSNAPHSLATSFAGIEWTRILAARVFSSQVGVAKPAAAIFEAALAALELGAYEVGFFDDRPTNVDGARAAGLRAALWTDAAAARSALAEWGVVLQ